MVSTGMLASSRNRVPPLPTMVLTLLLSIFFLSRAIPFAAPTPVSPSLTADVGYAKYHGSKTRSNTAAFLGVPYAEPPLGPLRFRKTVSLDTARISSESRGNPVDASVYADFCIQGAAFPGDRGGAGSENCLHVDIYRPLKATADSKLPVLVYFHGGAYVYGAPKNWPFDDWVDQHPHVVIVSVYYRLSALGFLAHPKLVGANGDMNAGLWDQHEALKWISKYIGSFGGDASKVTISGHSAGASSVELQLVASGSDQKPLFKQAIAQSIFRTSVMKPSQRTVQFDYLTQQTGCQDRGGFAAQLACLRGANPVLLMQAADQGWEEHGASLGWLWAPVVDNVLLRDYPINLFNAGKFAKVPILSGGTSNETFIGPDQDLTFGQAFPPLWPNMTPVNIAAIERVYATHSPWTGGDASRNAAGEAMNRCTTVIGGKFFPKAYSYRYNQPTPPDIATGFVGHSAENWMFFRGTATGSNGTTTFHPLSPSEEAFSRELIAYWVSFTRSGSPNTYKVATAPEWPKHGEGNGLRIVLQIPRGSYVEPIPADEVKRCEVIFNQIDGMQN